MLRLLSIRNFVVVEALDLELDGGFSVLTGETGAGKSILLDALALLLGDRFELRQLRPGAERAELAAVFDAEDPPGIAAWLAAHDLGAPDGQVLLRRTLDAQGRSRAWINGRPATLAQLKDIGGQLVDLHGQHEHQSLTAAEVQRSLVDAFGGFTVLARATADSWRAWNHAVEKRDAAAAAASASAAERESLEARRRELATLGVSAEEWATLTQTQSRLAHAAALIEAATAGEEALTDGDDALSAHLAALIAKTRRAVRTRPGARRDRRPPRIILPVSLLAVCGGLSGCATSTNTSGTASLAPTVAASDPILPDMVSSVPSFNPASGTAEEGMRSLAREVEMNASAQPAAYAAPTGSASLAAVQSQSMAAAETVPVPPGVRTRQPVAARSDANRPAGEPIEQDEPSMTLQTAVALSTDAAKVTLASLGDAAENFAATVRPLR